MIANEKEVVPGLTSADVKVGQPVIMLEERNSNPKYERIPYYGVLKNNG